MSAKISWKALRTVLVVGAVGCISALVAAAVIFNDVWREKPVRVDGKLVGEITTDQLATVDRTRVFFGHQSVGENILDGVPTVYEQAGMTGPPIEMGGTEPGPQGGFITHDFIGENEHPLLKIQDFDKTLRSGLGNKVDVAMMKLCFLDINTKTDVSALFEQYRDTISALERDFPDLRFVHMTVPLLTDSTIKNRIKIKLGGSDRYGQGENVMRERYNQLVRNEYGDRVFDIAAIESTAPDGTRNQLQYNGQPYHALYPGYASDIGHLNSAGSTLVATAFLQAIASASPR